MRGGGGGGAPTLVCGCVCPLLLGGEKREGDSGVTQGDWGVAWLRWARGIWSPGVPGFSIDGVGLVGFGGEPGVTSSSSPWDVGMDGLVGGWCRRWLRSGRDLGGGGGAGGEKGERKKTSVLLYMASGSKEKELNCVLFNCELILADC